MGGTAHYRLPWLRCRGFLWRGGTPGRLATLRELVTEAHAHGIKRSSRTRWPITWGPYHPWAADPPTTTWFHGSPSNHLENNWRTWTIPDLHATPEPPPDNPRGVVRQHLPDLNQDDPGARHYLIQNALWWVGVTGLDGIRQDTLPYVPAPSGGTGRRRFGVSIRGSICWARSSMAIPPRWRFTRRERRD